MSSSSISLLFIIFPHQGLCTLRSPMNVLFSRLNGPSSLSPYERCSSLLIIFAVLCWTHTNKSMACFYSEAQNWAQHLRCVLIFTNKRGRLIWQEWLCSWGHFLLQGCTAGFYCCSPRHWGPSWESCFPAGEPPGCTGAWGCVWSLPVCRALHFLNCMVFLLATPWLVQAPLKDGTTIWCTTYSFLSCILCELSEAAICPAVQVISEAIEHLWAHSEPWDAALRTCLQMDQRLSEFG